MAAIFSGWTNGKPINVQDIFQQEKLSSTTKCTNFPCSKPINIIFSLQKKMLAQDAMETALKDKFFRLWLTTPGKLICIKLSFNVYEYTCSSLESALKLSTIPRNPG